MKQDGRLDRIRKEEGRKKSLMEKGKARLGEARKVGKEWEKEERKKMKERPKE